MKASEAKLLDLLSKAPQFIIPIYQRTYSWTQRECAQLWHDILRAGRNDATTAHFVGSIVYIEQGLSVTTIKSPLLVIDGQQRLTTISLILEALARRVGDEEPVPGFAAENIRYDYLLNDRQKEDRRFKLLLTQTDKESLLALLQAKPWPANGSIRIKENFQFFEDRIAELGGDVEVLCKGLAKLVVVDIALNRDHDNPQLIFESMNSTGRELSQADLIRNFILMGLQPEQQEELYADHWRPMEVDFGQEAYGAHFDGFMRHYLTFKTGEIPNIGAVYEAFKAHARDPEVASAGVEALVADIHAFAGHYCAMALGHEPDKELDAAFQDLRELKVDVAYPFLLELYHDYAAGILQKVDFEKAIRAIESYVFRRAVCGIPTNTLNKTFATFGRAVKKNRYLESILAHLQLQTSYRRFPNDDEFQQEIKVRDLYNFRTRSYWLRKLENHNRKEPVEVNEYTIEHIMPQNPNLPKPWRDALGPQWQHIQQRWVHTLGNLTLTGYNSEYSDRPWPKKRDMDGGFSQSPLRLNKGLGEIEVWNEEAIQARANRLASLATVVWAWPGLKLETLEEFRPKGAETGAYSIDSYPKMGLGTPMRQLFEELRKEILALDPAVTEEFFKYAIAYRAEMNVATVEAQSARLRLRLNMSFPEVHDPRGICRDLGERHWGSGDVEFHVNKHDEIPYAIGLIRQSLEKQLGNGDAGL